MSIQNVREGPLIKDLTDNHVEDFDRFYSELVDLYKLFEKYKADTQSIIPDNILKFFKKYWRSTFTNPLEQKVKEMNKKYGGDSNDYFRVTLMTTRYNTHNEWSSPYYYLFIDVGDDFDEVRLDVERVYGLVINQSMQYSFNIINPTNNKSLEIKVVNWEDEEVKRVARSKGLNTFKNRVTLGTIKTVMNNFDEEYLNDPLFLFTAYRAHKHLF